MTEEKKEAEEHIKLLRRIFKPERKKVEESSGS